MVVLVYGQTDLVTDPGLVGLEGNQCGPDNEWHFRSDYLWNSTELFDSQCEASIELPTPAQPGLTKGMQSNINKAAIPSIPTVTGGDWPQSAAVVDMNTPCRAALWIPFEVANDSATVTVSLKLWVKSSENLQQVVANEGSQIEDADLLQYLQSPDGLLITTEDFPPTREETNMIRIDIIVPDDSESFYDRAFSLMDDHIAMQIPIPNWQDGEVTPANGTSGQWVTVSSDISSVVTEHGTYALRIASAQSRVGVVWGVSDVHIVTQGGTEPNVEVPNHPEADVLIEKSSKTIGGTAIFSKIVNL